jgi:UDP-N-acetylmuramate dehydrogenase
MRLGGNADYLIEVHDQATLIQAAENAKKNHLPIIIVGNGSNIVWRDEGFSGLVIVNRIPGFEVISQDDFGTYVSIGAGEPWDSVIERSVEMGLSGIECLSLIPGTAGATPVQNISAYGQEISQTLVTVTAYDLFGSQTVNIPAADCNFAYRSSIFNSSSKGRYLITGITLVLTRNKPLPPFYPSVANYLEQHGISDFTPAALRQAVVDIRRSKLPNPESTPNCGSFFHNPIVDESLVATLEEKFGSVPYWPENNSMFKLSAAWLIDKSGFGNYYDQQTGIATWPYQPLVFVNRSAKSTGDLLRFADKVKSAVSQRFGIELNIEPEILP